MYQKYLAEKISKLLDGCNQKELIQNIWIKTLLAEFCKKWTQIDFLRMDKYIMLLQTVIFHFLANFLENNESSVFFLLI